MLFLLPPSETKLDGGSSASRLELDGLAYPGLTGVRRDVIGRLSLLASDDVAALSALKLGPRQLHEVVRDREIETSPTMRALSRYTGVLFDPLDAARLSPAAWQWAHRHILVHSALFGPVRATDLIPAYRLSHDSRLPGASLRSTWRRPVSEVLDDAGEFVVDLRSEGYVGLGPAGDRSTYIRVVSDAGGRRRALNHFNKKSKGLLMAALLANRPTLETAVDFFDWCQDNEIVVEPGHETLLVAETLLERESVQVTGTGPSR
ncbi:peroxide stress protein YaaA [Frigoribacterium sp. CFBP9039]|uniref:YaaA family protein n=1 Tax=Frigoribacterium sp. CFBP9029 TaxID=3096541 RepID=UPI002A6AF39F|nr:peroxide stress protein YaaA [Frigoribacterium sp. CFBP9039]MDY0946933.1 peroxide stress protein YaaA [Frigoribacterium sp. CFBP9039]